MHARQIMVAVAILFAISSSLAAQTKWAEQTLKVKPSKRSEYDVAQTLDGKVYLFGGRAASGYLNDTWKWDGKVWKQITTTVKPSPRSGYCMTYDFLRKKVVMFSGWNGGSYPAETWEFDGTNWKNVSPKTQPGPRDWSAMAYDIRTQKTILFGGHDWRRATYGDTWSWDGKVWTKLAPKTNPPARTGHRMVFDANLGSVVMVGAGSAGPDLWQWTGTDWKAIKSTTKPNYAWMLSAAFDEFRKRLVVYHGTNTWEFDGTDWSRRLTTGGPGANFVPAFYDSARRQVGVFGGALGGKRGTPSDKMMFYGAAKPASYTAFGSGCKGSNGSVPGMTGTVPWIGESFSISVTGLPNSGSAFFYIGLSKTTWGAISLPFDLGVLGAAGCKLYTDPLLTVGLTNTGGSAGFSATLPNVASTAGATFYTQAWAPDSAANNLGLTVSNPVEGRIGAK
jgi:Galactose oxidase, central domain